MSKTMEQVLQVFTMRDLFTFKNILLTLQLNEKTIPEALGFIIAQEHDAPNAVWKQCPDCGSIAMLVPVNDQPCTQVGEGFVAMFFCETCGYGDFITKEALDDIILDRVQKSKIKINKQGCNGCQGGK